MILSVHLCRDILDELECLGILGMEADALVTLNVVSLCDSREAQKFEFLKVLADELGLVKVKTIFTVSAFAPTATKNHAACVAGFLEAVCALMLTAKEVDFGTSTRLGFFVEALVVI